MANLNIRTPRFYVDYINFMAVRDRFGGHYGIHTANLGGQQIAISSGSVAELYDMRPLNQVEFNTTQNSGQDHVNLWVDLKSSNFKVDFVAILNHNMHRADAKVRISASDTFDEVRTVDHVGADGQTSIGHADGTFDSTHKLKIGCILLGQFYDMPVAPDLSVKRSIEFDGVNVQESIGGQRFSSIQQFGRRTLADDNKNPFLTHFNSFGAYGGRMSYDMKFSYINSSNLMPSKHDAFQHTEDTIIEDLWNKTNGRHIPFIFTQDKTSTEYSDYLFARFAQDNLQMTQVAPDVFDVSMRIEEEF
jgi:hypothetical protein